MTLQHTIASAMNAEGLKYDALSVRDSSYKGQDVVMVEVRRMFGQTARVHRSHFPKSDNSTSEEITSVVLSRLKGVSNDFNR